MSEKCGAGKTGTFEGNVAVDDLVQRAFNNSGLPPNSVSREQLVSLSQIARSSTARDLFKGLTGRSIDSLRALEELFNAVSSSELDLDTILEHPSLSKYIRRRGQLNIT
jgi:hypothetical protein